MPLRQRFLGIAALVALWTLPGWTPAADRVVLAEHFWRTG